MSSMRNAVQRRNHKERAQPKQREKWGLLEKHKDYSLRAKDFNEKKRRIKLLRQKAADRNPDEFHFAMMSSKTDNHGVKIADRGNQALSLDTVALLKTQDAGYLRTTAQKTRKAIERLEQALTINKIDDGKFLVSSSVVDSATGPEHVSFVDDLEEQQAWGEHRALLSKTLADKLQNNPLGEDIDLDPVEHEQSTRQSRKTAQQAADNAHAAKINRKRRRRDREIRQTTLEILKKREKSLRAAEIELEVQRSKMNGGHGIGVTKTGVKFKNRARKK